MKKKFVTVLLAGVMAMGTLAGCGLGDAGTSNHVEDDEDDKEDEDDRNSDELTSEDTEEESEAVVLEKDGFYYIINEEEEVTVIDRTVFGTLSDGYSVSISDFVDGYAVASKDKYRYIIDTKGKIVTDLGVGYDYVYIISDEYALVMNETVVDNIIEYECGIINLDGEVVVGVGEYNFSSISGESFAKSFGENGVAVVGKDRKCGAINTKGDIVIEFGKYDSIDHSIYNSFGENGVAVVTKDKQYGVINTKGEIVVAFGKYDYIESFSDEVAIVTNSGDSGTGVIDTKGEVTVELGKYDRIMSFLNVVAVVTKDNQYGVINTKGEVVVEFGKYGTMWNSQYGYIQASKDNKTYALEFSDECVVVICIDEEGYRSCGVVTTDGEVVVEQEYYDISAFSNGVAVIRTDSQYGVINTKGEFIVDFGTYGTIKNFDENGVAVVVGQDGYGVINTNGEVVVEPDTYDSIKYNLRASMDVADETIFVDGYAFVNKGDETYIINTKGEVVYQFTE